MSDRERKRLLQFQQSYWFCHYSPGADRDRERGRDLLFWQRAWTLKDWLAYALTVRW